MMLKVLVMELIYMFSVSAEHIVLFDQLIVSLDTDAFNVLVNNGDEAGQVIFHVSDTSNVLKLLTLNNGMCQYSTPSFVRVLFLQTHVHIIPRSKDDGLWSSEVIGNLPQTPFAPRQLLSYVPSLKDY